MFRLRGFLSGSNANNSANCRLAYANANNAPSNANTNIGSQQCFKRNNDPATRQKINTSKRCRYRSIRQMTEGLRRLQIEKQNRMKRVGNIFEQIISLDNLRLADLKARRGKLRSYGVTNHDKSREENIQRLHVMLKEKSYRTSDYDVFKIFDPKEREIYRLPYFPDRIVHHAIMGVLEPVWVSVFTQNTYACIKGRGIHAAMKDVKIALKDRENTTYSLKLDIRKYYPSIDHAILKQLIRRKIKCQDFSHRKRIIYRSFPISFTIIFK